MKSRTKSLKSRRQKQKYGRKKLDANWEISRFTALHFKSICDPIAQHKKFVYVATLTLFIFWWNLKSHMYTYGVAEDVWEAVLCLFAFLMAD